MNNYLHHENWETIKILQKRKVWFVSINLNFDRSIFLVSVLWVWWIHEIPFTSFRILYSIIKRLLLWPLYIWRLSLCHSKTKKSFKVFASATKFEERTDQQKWTTRWRNKQNLKLFESFWTFSFSSFNFNFSVFLASRFQNFNFDFLFSFLLASTISFCFTHFFSFSFRLSFSK